MQTNEEKARGTEKVAKVSKILIGDKPCGEFDHWVDVDFARTMLLELRADAPAELLKNAADDLEVVRLACAGGALDTRDPEDVVEFAVMRIGERVALAARLLESSRGTARRFELGNGCRLDREVAWRLLENIGAGNTATEMFSRSLQDVEVCRLAVQGMAWRAGEILEEPDPLMRSLARARRMLRIAAIYGERCGQGLATLDEAIDGPNAKAVAALVARDPKRRAAGRTKKSKARARKRGAR